MVRRALLIGSGTYGLTGCDADVELVGGLLQTRGFDSIESVTGNSATRRRLVEAFRDLIEATSKDDAAVVYYSGHGGRQQFADWAARKAAGKPTNLQYIVPWDVDDSTEDEFKGFLAEELTEVQWQLTERTKNVTTILDCCHAGYMARSTDLVPKAISRNFPLDGATDLLAAIPPAHQQQGSQTNPNAVRIVACQPDQSAFEQQGQLGDGKTHGVLTESLAVVLGELGDQEVSWTTIGDLVRRRVLAAVPQQRPEVEGPGDRLPFTLTTRPRPLALPFQVDAGVASIGSAAILEISAGDTFAMAGPDGIKQFGTAAVANLAADRAVLTWAPAATPADLPLSGEASPLTRIAPKRAVAVAGTGPERDALAASIDASPRLTVAGPTDVAFASITADGGLVVRDAAGLRAHRVDLAADEPGRRAAVELVELLAAAERLRALDNGRGAAVLEQTVELGVVRYADGAPQPVKAQGDRLYVGDPVAVNLANRGSADTYVWLFDIGASGAISLVTNASPSGMKLGRAGTADSTVTIGGAAGTAMAWPASVPDDGERPETFVAIFADRQQDLSALVTTRGAARGAPASPLDAILDEYRVGVREFPVGQEAPSLRYRIEHVDFFLSPEARPRVDEPAFELNDQPDGSIRTLQPRGVTEPPKKVAVRLVELLIRQNRALFRASIRIDTLVITRGADGQPGIAAAQTFRFESIGDNELLPMDNVLLYLGDVVDILEIAIWVNRDRGVASDLADQFATELNGADAQGALTALGGLALAAPQVAASVAAVAAVATLVRVAAGLVATATGNNVGTYRTSRLAFERFGEGRTPSAGRRQAQNIEFAYEVVEVP